MATVNIGAIKFNWKGAYNSSTSYAVDDVVSSGGNSYVCIQAHSNQAVGNATAYWNIMSSAGTNGTDGTDLTSTLTTQGDILYRNGSGLQRLGAGTSGQALITGGAGANPSWGDAGGGKLLQYKISSDSSSRSQTGNFNSELSNTMGNTITPTKVGSRIIAWTTKIRWYTYGPGTLSLRRDGSVVNSMSHSNAAYPDSNEIETSLYNEFTTTGTSQLSYTINLQDTGSSAGSGALLFNQAQGLLHLLEVDA